MIGGGSNVVVMERVVRSMGTGRVADASLRVEERNDAGRSWFGVQCTKSWCRRIRKLGDFGGDATRSDVTRGLLSNLSMGDELPVFRLVCEAKEETVSSTSV